jgi:hypothetical protein
MQLRRRVAFATLLIISTVVPPVLAAGSLSVYFDSGYTKTQLTDLEPGTQVVFYVVAEDMDPADPSVGLAGFTFGVEADENSLLLFYAPVAGTAIELEPLTPGRWRYETYVPAGACISPDASGRVKLAEGIFVWMGPGPDGETIVDLGGAVRMDPARAAPTWFACDGGARTDFTTIIDGHIGPSGGPECQLSATAVDFGNMVAGSVITRNVTISNQGGGTLRGNVSSGCGQVTVTAGSGPFALTFGQTLTVQLEFAATQPGMAGCVISTGTDCNDIAVFGNVIDPGDIAEPAGAIAVYLDAALTQRVALNQIFGTAHTFYVVAEGLPPGANVNSYEVALDLDDFLVAPVTFNPSGSSVSSADVGDYIVDRNACPTTNAAGKDLLFIVSAPMVVPNEDYTATVAPTGSAASALGLGAAPLWIDCDGVVHPFAEVKGARIQYIDPDACVRGPAAVDYGRVYAGEARTQTVTITNTGIEPATGTLAVDCSAFSIVSGADYQLAPQESHEVVVRFAPAGTGEYGCGLFGGPMCNPVLLTGRGSAPRAVGAAEGRVAVYFDPGLTVTAITPTPGLFASLYLVASDFDAGFTGLDGAELSLELPGDMLIVDGTAPYNIGYAPDGSQTVTLLADLSTCRPADAGGRVVLARLQYLYLPLFPDASAATVVAAPVMGGLFDPPAPGWTECGGDAHPFAVLQPATVYRWDAAAPDSPTTFLRRDGDDTVTLNWEAQGDATRYRLFRGDTPDFVPGRANLVAEVWGTGYSEHVPDPTRYHYKLSAVDGGGLGSPAVIAEDYTVAVAISAFDARATGAGVELTWEIFADEPLSGFRVYRARGDDAAIMIHDALPVHERRYTDTDIAPGASYTYTLAAVTAGGEEIHSIPARVSAAPAVTALEGNFPNPFNPSTTVAFSLAQPARVRMQVFDAAGRLVTTLADGTFPAGRNHLEWDGRNRAGTPSASGVYFLRFIAPGVHQTRKMVLLK